MFPGGPDETPAPPPDRDAGAGAGPPQAHDTTTKRQDPGVHLAAVEHLHAEALSLGVPAVPSRAATFGLAHLLIPVISIVL